MAIRLRALPHLKRLVGPSEFPTYTADLRGVVSLGSDDAENDRFVPC